MIVESLCDITFETADTTTNTSSSTATESLLLLSPSINLSEELFNIILEILIDNVLSLSSSSSPSKDINQLISYYFYESFSSVNRDDNYDHHDNEEKSDILHNEYGRLSNMLQVYSMVIYLVGIYISKMNMRMHGQINNDKESTSTSKEEREPKIERIPIIKVYENLAEVLHKTAHGIVRVFDEFLIPLVMSYLDLKTLTQTNNKKDDNHDSITIIQELFSVLADLFDLPTTSHQIFGKYNQIKKDWKNLLASKFVSTGLLEIALRQNHNFRQVQPNSTNGFDRFLVAVIGRLSGFLLNVEEIDGGGGIRQGNVMPENFAFGNLPGEDNNQDDNMLPQTITTSTSKKGYKALSQFLTKYMSLDFLHDKYEETNNLNLDFKPHTYSKILASIKSILQEEKDNNNKSYVENFFFMFDYVFLEWIWRVCKRSWSMKGFVGDLQSLRIGEMLFGNEFATEIFLSLLTNSMLNDKTIVQQKQQSFQFKIVVSLTVTLLSSSSSSSENINNNHKNYNNNDDKISNPVINNVLVFWTTLLKYVLFGGSGSGILMLERLPLDWWQPINHILLVLGKRFNRYIVDNLGSLSGVLDYALSLLQSINEYEKISNSMHPESKKDNNENEPENEIFFIAEKFLLIVNFLSILANISTGKALIEIQQHPIFLPALRDRISRKIISTHPRNTAEFKYRLEIVSVILGLLNKSIPEVILFPSMNEILMFLHMAKIESALIAGHLCTTVKRGFDLTLEIFRKNTKWIYISIWNILRDFVVSEIDNQFTWFLLLLISDSFQTMIEKSPPQLVLPGNNNAGSSKLCRTYLLLGAFRLLEFFTLQNPLWIKEIFTENIIDMIISLLDQIVTNIEQKSCAVTNCVMDDDEFNCEELCYVLLSIIQKLLQVSLITKTHHHHQHIARILDSFVLHRQEQLSNIPTEETISSKIISEELLFIK
ncbi:2501_t:CDS:10 [Ambispora leptoticha]|uniref:2501_t:CDS:1 n=1 Tax=Ambispora leptoticha TaxID=144679 RepID=A0A9N8ZX68_9GLOM|nr:2501_t:CDS:10 [Ambispora leptoticha]